MKNQKLIITAVTTIETKRKSSTDFDDVTHIEDIRCSNGNSREFYEDMNIPVPKDIIAKEKEFLRKQEGSDDTDSGDVEVEEITTTAFVPITYFYMCVGNYTKDGSTVYLENGFSIICKETADEIYAQLEYLEQNFIQRTIHKLKQRYGSK